MCCLALHGYDIPLLLQVAAAVFAFRGTKLNKAGNLRADLHLMQDLNAEMVVTQRATKKVQNHIKRLQEQFQSVRWTFYTTGLSILHCLCVHVPSWIPGTCYDLVWQICPVA